VVGREVAWRIVFCAIEHTGLQRREDFTIGHGNAVAAHRVHGVHKQWVTHHAHFLTFEVVWLGDFLLGVEAARAAIHEA
jgi:hypothetical protein